MLYYYEHQCILIEQAVEEQFADTNYDLTVVRRVKFQSTTIDAKPAIEIKFKRSLLNGWIITRESESKVFWPPYASRIIHLMNG